MARGIWVRNVIQGVCQRLKQEEQAPTGHRECLVGEHSHPQGIVSAHRAPTVPCGRLLLIGDHKFDVKFGANYERQRIICGRLSCFLQQ